MLDSLTTHSLMDVTVRAKGDLQHHIVEDVAITLGKAMSKALGDRAGIRRFGDAIVPMDDGLALAAVDLVKRPYSAVDLKLQRVMLEDAPERGPRALLRLHSASSGSDGPRQGPRREQRPPQVRGRSEGLRASPERGGRTRPATRKEQGPTLVQRVDVSGRTCA